MKEVYVELGGLIRNYRIKNNMTQLDLAKKLGYDSTQFVSLFERGMSKVPTNTLGQLIVILGIPEKKVTKVLIDAYQDQLISDISEGKSIASGKVS
jgi:transcriptional regulator with XRE-family HTH domain